MENLLNIVESWPIWVKISIPLAGTFLLNLVVDLKCNGIKNITIVEDIKAALKMVLSGAVAYTCIVILVGIAQLILSIWDIHIWSFVINHFWLLFYVFIVLIYVYAAIAPRKSKSLYYSYGTSRQANKPLTETRKTVRPVVIPINKPNSSRKADNSPAPSNMTDVENKLRNGINVKLDFDKTWSKIEGALRIIKRSGAKITFCNIKNPKQSGTLGNMKRIVSQAPGRIIYDIVIEAGFEAKELAASGACFACDCSNKSTNMPDIAKAAIDNKGYVKFIKTNRLDSSVLKRIREMGGLNFELQ